MAGCSDVTGRRPPRCRRAIRTILSCLAAHKAVAPQEVAAGLQDCLAGYKGSAPEDTLRVLITQLRVSTRRGFFV